MADAWAKQDMHRWEAAARRHLVEIDRSDPDLCFLLAQHLAHQGAESAAHAMYWADQALGNQHRWTGDLRVDRMYRLYRIKAVVSQQHWHLLEKRYLSVMNAALLKDKESWRNVSKVAAREWLEYARDVGMDESLALEMCLSAAGTRRYCLLE